MKRSDLLFLLWALGGIGLAAMFFVTLNREHHLGWHAELFLLACFVWSQLLRLIGGKHDRRQ